jgi:hypothetical protein
LVLAWLAAREDVMDSRRKQRWRLALGAMTVEAAGAAYHLLVRPRMLVWGMTEQEARRPLPGDELEPDPVVNTTYAVTSEPRAEPGSPASQGHHSRWP